MNFLLHRHLAARDLDSGVGGLGAMLPDLWPMADRRVRPRPAMAGEPPRGDGVTGELLRGVHHHLEADAWFHSSEVFQDGLAATAEAFRAAAGKAGRLLAHIAWELCLDGALVRRQGLDRVLDALGLAVETARGEPLRHAVKAWHPPFEHDLEALEHFDSSLRDLLDRLLAGDWIDGYQTGVGLADRLGGVRRRVGLPTWSSHDADRLAAALDEMLGLAEQRLDDLLTRRVA